MTIAFTPFRLCLVCLISLAVAGFGPAARAQQDAPKPAVTVVPVALEAIDDSAVFTGRVEAVDHIEVRARVSGFVQSVGFDEGAKVAAGDTLFEIEPDAYEAAVTQIQGQVQSADAENTIADIEVNRQRTLFESDTVAEAVVQRAEAEQGRIEGQILQLQGSLRAAELDLSYTKITAPFTGRVGLSDIDVGAFVGPESGSLVILSSIDPIYVTFPVAEAVLLDFRAKRAANPDSAPVTATIVLANKKTYPEVGRIEVVDVAVQAGTDTVLVRASFPNPDGALLDGQLVDLTITDEAAEKSLTVPVQSLQRDQAGHFVMVVGDDDKVEKRPIVLARVAGLRAVISDGVKEGENVIFEGMQRARVGAIVDAEPAAVQPKGQ